MARIPTSVLVSGLVLSCASASPDKAQSEAIGTTAQALVGDGTGPFVNASGLSANLSTKGFIDKTNPFFHSLGTNGRACVSCHSPGDGFSITPASVSALFDRCGLGATPAGPLGADDAIACAIFRTNDGSNSPNADVSTPSARRAAYSMLLSKGLVRFSFPVPPNADFDVVAVDDPYGYATTESLSVFRRPLPATNLGFESGIMWDLRETSQTLLLPPFTVPLTLNQMLMSQANDATLGHAQATAPLSTDEQQSIVDFELTLYSAQVSDTTAGPLFAAGATGGPLALSQQAPTPVNGNQFYIDPDGGSFDPNVFTLFDSWAGFPGKGSVNEKRASIARGQVLFNTRKSPPVFPPDPLLDPTGVTCSGCHVNFNEGTDSVPVGFAEVNVSDVAFRTPDLPLYTLRCNAAGAAGHGPLPGCTLGQTVQTTDPGRALITGLWFSLNAFKAPALRNLAARAPYFHNGSAATLTDVVDHYKTALNFVFTDAEEQDLVNFLSAL